VQDIQQFNQHVIERFRASGGRGELGPVRFENLVLLTTTGRRSGQPRTVPLGAARDDDGHYLLFASNMGAPRHPDWYLNLESDPRVRLEVPGAGWEAKAEILDGAEREAAYRRWLELAPNTAGHQEKAGRTIPMVRIRRPAEDEHAPFS
jgi:deazaflavin-dependent oxidoreductase (nitroreductase family)